MMSINYSTSATRYLLDANVFIQANNFHYGLDFCPGFWEWLIRGNQAGIVNSIEQVADELRAIEDELTAWTQEQEQAGNFFLKSDTKVEKALETVSRWAYTTDYKSAAISIFFQTADFFHTADCWLVAHALAYDYVVVTHEVPADTIRKIKIPNACTALGLNCITPYEMLRREGARFVLAPGSRVG